MRMPRLVVLLLAATLLAAAPAAAEPPAPAAVEEAIRQYILDHPEVILESMRRYQVRRQEEGRQRAAAAIAAHREALLDDPAAPRGGNRQGDVTVVEFFDYRCGHCRRAAPLLRQLLAEDGGLRVVYKELPILGPESALAARVALAAHRQGKYEAVHAALMAADGPFTTAAVQAAAVAAGCDPVRLETDMAAPAIQEALDRNAELAAALGVEGTPAFVIGGALVPGTPTLEALKALIAAARYPAPPGP
jgi:protein-disulfide isomerase